MVGYGVEDAAVGKHIRFLFSTRKRRSEKDLIYDLLRQGRYAAGYLTGTV